MWLEAGLGWKDFLPEDEDVNKFVTEQVLKAVLYCIDGQHNFYVKTIITAQILKKYILI